MADAVKNVAIRLYVDGEGKVAAALTGLEQKGKAAFSTITTSAKGALPVLQAFVPLLGVASVAGISAFVSESLRMAASLGDTAEQLGVNVERLQDYRFAATQNGAAVTDMDRALSKFVTTLGDAVRGNEDAQSRLAKAGVHWRDQAGNVRDADAAWSDFANRIAASKNEQEALSLLGDTLGEKFGPKLANALRQGAAGFDEAGRQLEAWGAKLSAETVRTAKEFDDWVDRIQTTAKAWAARAATEAPSIAEQALRPYTNFVAGLAQLNNEAGSLIARLMSGGRYGTAPTGGTVVSHPPGISAPIAGDPTSYPGYTPPPSDPARPPPVDPKLLRQQADALAKQEEMFAEDLAGAWKAYNDFIVKMGGERVQIQTDHAAAIAKAEEMAAEDAAGAWEAFGKIQDRLAADMERLRLETLTEAERFAEDKERLDQLLAQGLDPEIYRRKLRDMEGYTAEFQRFGERAFDRVGDAMTRNAVEGGNAWRQAGNIATGVLSELLQETANLAFLNPLKNALFDQRNPTLDGVLGRIFGPGGWGLSGAPGGFFSNFSSDPWINVGSAFDLSNTFHEGGIVGAGTSLRAVHAGAWGGARRYHRGGLVAGERAIVARDGEEVLTRDDPRHRFNMGAPAIVVQNIDQRSSGAPVRTEQSRGPDGQILIRTIIRDEVDRAISTGRLDRSMQRNFGIGRAPIDRG